MRTGLLLGLASQGISSHERLKSCSLFPYLIHFPCGFPFFSSIISSQRHLRRTSMISNDGRQLSLRTFLNMVRTAVRNVEAEFSAARIHWPWGGTPSISFALHRMNDSLTAWRDLTVSSPHPLALFKGGIPAIRHRKPIGPHHS
jgi:hypothetical protein